MNIISLQPPHDLSHDKNWAKQVASTEKVLEALRAKPGTPEAESSINQLVEALNAHESSPADWVKAMRRARNQILQYVLKHLKLVPRNYYRTLWTPLGMSAIGLPIGVAMGAALGNMAFLGIGLPIGLSLGMILGGNMDKKAAAEGRQLDVEVGGR